MQGPNRHRAARAWACWQSRCSPWWRSTSSSRSRGRSDSVWQLARVLVSLQLVFNIVILATAAPLLTRTIRSRRISQVQQPPSQPRPDPVDGVLHELTDVTEDVLAVANDRPAADHDGVDVRCRRREDKLGCVDARRARRVQADCYQIARSAGLDPAGLRPAETVMSGAGQRGQQVPR